MEKSGTQTLAFELDEFRARYEREFGAIPRFRAGLHGGMVIAGELGDLKREIVFVGGILNTAARLEEYARSRELAFVASAAVVDPLELPTDVIASPSTDGLRPPVHSANRILALVFEILRSGASWSRSLWSQAPWS